MATLGLGNGVDSSALPRGKEPPSVPKLTNLKATKVVSALERLGWSERRTSRGKNPHTVMKKPGNPALLTIPRHKGKDVSAPLLERLLKEAGISIDEFQTALKRR